MSRSRRFVRVWEPVETAATRAARDYVSAVRNPERGIHAEICDHDYRGQWAIVRRIDSNVERFYRFELSKTGPIKNGVSLSYEFSQV